MLAPYKATLYLSRFGVRPVNFNRRATFLKPQSRGTVMSARTAIYRFIAGPACAGIFVLGLLLPGTRRS